MVKWLLFGLAIFILVSGCSIGNHWRSYTGTELPDSDIAQITRDKPRITRDKTPEACELTVVNVCGRNVSKESGGFFPYRIDLIPAKCDVVINYTEIVKTPGLAAFIGEQAIIQVKQTSIALQLEAGTVYHVTSNYDFSNLEIYLDINNLGKLSRIIAPQPVTLPMHIN